MNLEEISAKLSQQSTKVLNDWLQRCVEKHCPLAIAYFRLGYLHKVSDILRKEGFHYLSHQDGKYEFCIGDTVLERCKIEIKLDNSCSEE